MLLTRYSRMRRSRRGSGSGSPRTCGSRPSEKTLRSPSTVPSLRPRVRVRIALMRARISRTWIGLRTTSSTPAANRSSVSSSDLLSFMAMTAARERPLISRGNMWRCPQSPSRKASTAIISGSDTVLTQLLKSDGTKPVAETPSRSNQAVYPCATDSRSSTITIIGYPPNRIDRCLLRPYVPTLASSTDASRRSCILGQGNTHFGYAQ